MQSRENIFLHQNDCALPQQCFPQLRELRPSQRIPLAPRAICHACAAALVALLSPQSNRMGWPAARDFAFGLRVVRRRSPAMWSEWPPTRVEDDCRPISADEGRQYPAANVG